MGITDIPQEIFKKFEIHEWKHSIAILKNDFPEEWNDITEMLKDFSIDPNWISAPGGRKSQIADWIDQFLAARGWVEKGFDTAITVDDMKYDSPTHKIDCFKNSIALETEWNNKDPFYDRDLNNFRLLFDLRAVSVGIIITRGDELQSYFDSIGKGSSYGASTTHMSKLIPRIEGGGGAGCPLLVFGIKTSCIRGA